MKQKLILKLNYSQQYDLKAMFEVKINNLIKNIELYKGLLDRDEEQDPIIRCMYMQMIEDRREDLKDSREALVEIKRVMRLSFS